MAALYLAWLPVLAGGVVSWPWVIRWYAEGGDL